MKLLCQLCVLVLLSYVQASSQSLSEVFQMTSLLGSGGYRSVESTRDGGFVFGLRIQADNSVRDPILDGIKELGRDFNVLVFKLKAGNVEWVYQNSRAVDDVVDLAADSLGNILLLGRTLSGPKERDGVENLAVIKISPEGNLIWEKIFGGSQREEAKSIAVGVDNRILVVAVSASTDYDVPDNHGGFDWWILNLDEEGSVIWSKVLGGSQSEQPGGVISTSDGGCVIVGYSMSNDGGFDTNLAGADAWAVRLDSTGKTEWRTRLGSSGLDKFINGKEYAGNFYLLGACNYWDGNIDTSTWKGGEDYWLVKLSGSGEVLSQRFFGSSMREVPVDIAFIPAGPQFVIAGETGFRIGDGYPRDISRPRAEADSYSQSVGNDWWILVVDTNLVAVDDFVYGGSSYEYCSSVAANRSSFVVCGRTSSNDGNVKGYKGTPSPYNPPVNFWIVEISTGVASVQDIAGSKIESCFAVNRNFTEKTIELISLCDDNDIEGVEIFNLTGKKIYTPMQDGRVRGIVKLQIPYISEVTSSLFVVIRMANGQTLYKVI